MNKSKIEWCDMTWNPVTGCLHGCEYCYARGIARRFEGGDINKIRMAKSHIRDGLVMRELSESKLPYPFGFDPTLHCYRLDEPARKTKPQTIFVGSMCDLFGDWVPDEWIKAVFDACAAAPWHRYLFLTKNPRCYHISKLLGIFPTTDNFWFGFTINNQSQLELRANENSWLHYNTFVSIEPIFGATDIKIEPRIRWVIIGAETGNRKGKVIPERKWIENIVTDCREADTFVFMKNSLADIWGEPLIQEYPWEVKK